MALKGRGTYLEYPLPYGRGSVNKNFGREKPRYDFRALALACDAVLAASLSRGAAMAFELQPARGGDTLLRSAAGP